MAGVKRYQYHSGEGYVGCHQRGIYNRWGDRVLHRQIERRIDQVGEL